MEIISEKVRFSHSTNYELLITNNKKAAFIMRRLLFIFNANIVGADLKSAPEIYGSSFKLELTKELNKLIIS